MLMNNNNNEIPYAFKVIWALIWLESLTETVCEAATMSASIGPTTRLGATIGSITIAFFLIISSMCSVFCSRRDGVLLSSAAALNILNIAIVGLNVYTIGCFEQNVQACLDQNMDVVPVDIAKLTLASVGLLLTSLTQFRIHRQNQPAVEELPLIDAGQAFIGNGAALYQPNDDTGRREAEIIREFEILP